MTGLRAARRALANGDVLAAELGFALFSLVLHGSWVALLVYAFDQGGVGEAGVVGFVVLAPAAVAAPLVSVLFNRLPPHRALAAGFGAQAATLTVVAAVIVAGAPNVVVYGAMAAFTIPQMASRPTMSAVLPVIVDDPAELAAANSTSGLIETLGAVLGPALVAAVLVTVDGLAAPFVVAAVLMAGATAATLFVSTSGSTFDDGPAIESPMAEMVGGLRLVGQESAPRLLLSMLAAGLVIFGALDVALVAIAVEQLGRSEATAGMLGSAIGLGGVIGAALSFLLVGRRRLSGPVAFGSLAVAVPTMALAATNSLILVLGLLALTGLGRPVVEVAGRTLLQGLSAEDTLARIFGLLEGMTNLALAVGSLGFSLLAVRTNLTTALLLFGMLLPFLLLFQFTKLRRIDEARPETDPALLALVRGVPLFAPLPAFQVEQMLVNLDTTCFQPGERVFARGDHGHLLYLVAEGSAVIDLTSGSIETEVGGFFGEIALLRDQPRMASVRAGSTGLVAHTLERSVFLSAVNANGRSRNRTEREIERRLGE